MSIPLTRPSCRYLMMIVARRSGGRIPRTTPKPVTGPAWTCRAPQPDLLLRGPRVTTPRSRPGGHGICRWCPRLPWRGSPQEPHNARRYACFGSSPRPAPSWLVAPGPGPRSRSSDHFSCYKTRLSPGYVDTEMAAPGRRSFAPPSLVLVIVSERLAPVTPLKYGTVGWPGQGPRGRPHPGQDQRVGQAIDKRSGGLFLLIPHQLVETGNSRGPSPSSLPVEQPRGHPPPRCLAVGKHEHGKHVPLYRVSDHRCG